MWTVQFSHLGGSEGGGSSSLEGLRGRIFGAMKSEVVSSSSPG